jgi:predicted TIM-barrel fold metal-dependent hydrolase
MSPASSSEQVRKRLGHPVIDTDGHMIEWVPGVLPYLRESLSAELFDRYTKAGLPMDRITGGQGMPFETRISSRTPQGAWWGSPAENTRDLATAALPRLLYERLDEMGIDYCVLFPTKSAGAAGLADEELRRGVCRGFNDLAADLYGPYRDRLAAAAIIPMHTPEEAVAELEYCRTKGFKVAAFPEGVTRRIANPIPDNPSPWLTPGQTHWFDTFGLDSAHDYDPVWEACTRLGFAVTFHCGLGNLAPNSSPSITSYVYNHLGSFAERMQRVAKGLFLGGVTRRFPGATFGFMECGVAWACALLADLVEHWEKRNVTDIQHLDPARIDWDQLASLVREYGDGLGAILDEGRPGPEALAWVPNATQAPAHRDDFAAAGIATKQDLRDRFVPPYFFGCEGDDRTVAFAFSPANAFAARLQPVFGSDIGHWDVPEMNGVVAEAHGMVERGILGDEDFRDFVFANPVRMFTAADPHFFEGTAVEAAVRAVQEPAASTR